MFEQTDLEDRRIWSTIEKRSYAGNRLVISKIRIAASMAA
jgi:hypothetical protein